MPYADGFGFFGEYDRPHHLVQADLDTRDALAVVNAPDMDERAMRVALDHVRARHSAALPVKLSQRASTTLA